jgi:hypothetical protein
VKSTVLSQTDDLTWPIVALVIFALTFAAVAIRVLRRGGADPDHLQLAQLPLADDAGAATPAPKEARHG